LPSAWGENETRGASITQDSQCCSSSLSSINDDSANTCASGRFDRTFPTFVNFNEIDECANHAAQTLKCCSAVLSFEFFKRASEGLGSCFTSACSTCSGLGCSLSRREPLFGFLKGFVCGLQGSCVFVNGVSGVFCSTDE
jgi:hypothetical protein